LLRAVQSLKNRTTTLAGKVSTATKKSLASLDPRTREQLNQIKTMADTVDDAELVLKIMKNNTSNPTIQARACEKLSNIAVRESQGLVHLGTIEVLVKAMEKFPKNANVQEFACQLAWNLAVIDEHKQLLADKGVLELLCLAMDNHKSKISVLHKAIGAIKLLSLIDKAKEQLVNDGAIEKIVEVMQNYAKEESDTAEFQETCLDCIQNFAFGKTLAPRLYDLGVSSLILDVMKKYEEAEDIQSSGCAALWNVALGITEENLIELTELGATNRLIYALKTQSENQRVVLHAMGALKNHSRVSESIGLIKEKAKNSDMDISNVYDIIMQAYYAHQEDNNIRRIGEELLSEFDDEDDDEVSTAEAKQVGTLTINQTEAQIRDPFADLEATAGGDDDMDDY